MKPLAASIGFPASSVIGFAVCLCHPHWQAGEVTVGTCSLWRKLIQGRSSWFGSEWPANSRPLLLLRVFGVLSCLGGWEKEGEALGFGSLPCRPRSWVATVSSRRLKISFSFVLQNYRRSRFGAALLSVCPWI